MAAAAAAAAGEGALPEGYHPDVQICRLARDAIASMPQALA